MRFRCAVVYGYLLTASAILANDFIPRTGDINFYGLRKVSEEKARSVLGIKEGDPLPPSKGDLEERLERLSQIAAARVEAVCCEDRKVVLFVGVEERGAPHFAFRSSPTGNAVLPDEIVQTHRELLRALEAAGRRGDIREDLTRGHSLMADPDARALQEKFLALAAQYTSLLKDVLRNAAEAEHRAIAAAVIGYAPDKAAIVDDLLYAMTDPDEAVRASAVRSLNAIAVLARRQPQLGIQISPTWFVEMLNSLVLTDRTRAAVALVSLTENGGEKGLDQIRDRALQSVIEMARWKTLRYALPAFILAGRMAGLPDQQIQDAWTQGRKEAVIEKLLGSRGK